MQTAGRDLLGKIKNAELLGESAHKIYSPPYRPLFSEDEILKKNPKLAAVNILLYLKENEWYFPLILRTENVHDKHSGQISLPGGKREESDIDFAQTAIRETCEEIGIPEYSIRIIRKLSSLYIPPSNFFVHPYISFTTKNPKFYIQETEAVELIEFPVSALLSLPQIPETAVVQGSRDTKVPVISFENYKIWGATSMILSEFHQLLKKL